MGLPLFYPFFDRFTLKIMPKIHKRDYLQEFEPPEKKLVSSGDILIKELVKKQQNTKINLEEQLVKQKKFTKHTEIVSITQFQSGECNVKRFQELDSHVNEIEVLKGKGLSDDEIDLYFDYRKGNEYVLEKHKNYEKNLLVKRIQEIVNIVEKEVTNDCLIEEKVDVDDNKSKMILAMKPESVETKLLKFVLNNEENKDRLPHPMDGLKEFSQLLTQKTEEVSLSNIRRKARKLGNRIKIPENSNERKIEQTVRGKAIVKTKWDVKEVTEDKKIEIPKVYSCRPKKLYTIKNGEIVEMGKEPKSIIIGDRLSLNEIKAMPKFANYVEGEQNEVLYVKNLARVTERDLKSIFGHFGEVSLNVLSGRMKGQAFVTYSDIKSATEALSNLNGKLINNKPMIVQYKKKNDTYTNFI